jgi:hypothetical protein
MSRQRQPRADLEGIQLGRRCTRVRWSADRVEEGSKVVHPSALFSGSVSASAKEYDNLIV